MSRYLLIVLAAVLLTGCGDLLSTEALANKSNTVFDPALIGAWSTEDAVITAQKGDDQGYRIRWMATDSNDLPRLTAFDGHLVKIGDQRIMDLVSSDPGGFAIPGHVFLRIRPVSDGLKVQFVDSKWIRERLKGSGLASFAYDNSTVLTSPAAQIEAFLKKFGFDEQALDNPMLLKPLKRK